MGTWRTLSKDEWTYLFDTRTFNNGANTGEGYSYQRATINSDATSVYGMILYPDNYTSQTDATSYTSTEWTTMEENGCVFLPAAGYRDGSNVDNVGVFGYYWSSTAFDVDFDFAYRVSFNSHNVAPGGAVYRKFCCSVRLVTDASVTPAPTPTTTGTAKATIGGSQVDVNWIQLWKDGPKFAEYNVGASSATDKGDMMTYTEATAENFTWGPNWCTPSKADMEHLMTAAKGQTDEKVKCEYTQVGSTYGFKFTGLTDGYTSNSVFFRSQVGGSGGGYTGYWSATANDSEAWYMYLNYGYENWHSEWRSGSQGGAFLMRPVFKN